MKKFLGFTLAEVLITLGIIGVVAAMTMPVLVQNYKKQTTVNRLKSTYSILYNAIRASENDNGNLSEWDYSLGGQEFFEKYLQNYLKVVKTYSFQELDNLLKYKWLDSDKIVAEFNSEYEQSDFGRTYVLANGSMITLKYNVLFIDINGLQEPNRMGKDLFLFQIIKPYGLVPKGALGTITDDENYQQTREYMLSCPKHSRACKSGSVGYFCGELIMLDGWKIAPDYPW